MKKKVFRICLISAVFAGGYGVRAAQSLPHQLALGEKVQVILEYLGVDTTTVPPTVVVEPKSVTYLGLMPMDKYAPKSPGSTMICTQSAEMIGTAKIGDNDVQPQFAMVVRCGGEKYIVGTLMFDTKKKDQKN